MNHALATAASVSILSLILGSGCASSPSRAQSESSASSCALEGSSTEVSSGSVDLSDELVIGTPFSAESVPKYSTPVNQYTLAQIQAELEAMFDLDRKMVSESFLTGEQAQSSISTIRAIDRVEGDRLMEIVDHIGWPTRDLVGLKATQAAYMVIQHAGHNIEFQNRCLAMMVDLVESGELPASYVALLTDRIRVFQGMPQVFGTQMAMMPNEHGMLVPTPTVPIEDPEHLNDRRKLMGMPPHSEFVNAIAIAYEASRADAGKAFANILTDE